MLVENTLGKGKAWLVGIEEYPADDGVKRFAEDMVRVVLQGEQGDIRFLGSDRVRYAVYETRLPDSRKKASVIYMLNTDPDCASLARIWVKGKTSQEFTLPENDLRLAYHCGDLLLIPTDKRVDLASWKTSKGAATIEAFSFLDQEVEAHNLGKAAVRVALNGASRNCKPGECVRIKLKRKVDPERKEFFVKDFMREPAADLGHAVLPY